MISISTYLPFESDSHCFVFPQQQHQVAHLSPEWLPVRDLIFRVWMCKIQKYSTTWCSSGHSSCCRLALVIVIAWSAYIACLTSLLTEHVVAWLANSDYRPAAVATVAGVILCGNMAGELSAQNFFAFHGMYGNRSQPREEIFERSRCKISCDHLNSINWISGFLIVESEPCTPFIMGANQHKKNRMLSHCWIEYFLIFGLLAPLEDLKPHILKYWKMRKTDLEIVNHLREKHIDLTKHSLGFVQTYS